MQNSYEFIYKNYKKVKVCELDNLLKKIVYINVSFVWLIKTLEVMVSSSRMP